MLRLFRNRIRKCCDFFGTRAVSSGAALLAVIWVMGLGAAELRYWLLAVSCYLGYGVMGLKVMGLGGYRIIGLGVRGLEGCAIGCWLLAVGCYLGYGIIGLKVRGLEGCAISY